MDRKPEDISIACCLWGSWPANHDNPYLGIEYVNRLYRAVERNTTMPHRFFCFTDKKETQQFDKGIIVAPIETPCRLREIAKLYVYCPDNGLTGRVIVIDLDTVILRNIDPLLLRKETFIVRKAFNPRYIEKFNGIGGDLISFDAGFGDWIWKDLKDDPRKVARITHGDERKAYNIYLRDTAITFWQDLFPNRYISFKNHIRHAETKEDKEKALEEAWLVSFHGRPRPHALQHRIEWIKNNWK